MIQKQRFVAKSPNVFLGSKRVPLWAIYDGTTLIVPGDLPERPGSCQIKSGHDGAKRVYSDPKPDIACSGSSSAPASNIATAVSMIVSALSI